MIVSKGLENEMILDSWIPYNEALKVIADSDLLVLTSRYEGLPYSVIEAMQLSKAVVATDVDGTRDIVIDKKTGYLVTLDDAAQMADKIEALLKNPALRNKFGKNARKEYENSYNASKRIVGIEQIYSKILLNSK